MKTKLFFFILLLVMGAGKGFAQSTNPDSLLQEIQEELSLVENWETTVPGTPDQKVLAILTGKPVQVADSVVITNHRWIGMLYHSTTHYYQYIFFDKKTKNLKKIITKKNKEIHFVLPILYSLIFMIALGIITYNLYWGNLPIDILIVWTIIVGIHIYLSYYVGSICAILSFICIIKGYIDDYELKKAIKNLKKS